MAGCQLCGKANMQSNYDFAQHIRVCSAEPNAKGSRGESILRERILGTRVLAPDSRHIGAFRE